MARTLLQQLDRTKIRLGVVAHATGTLQYTTVYCIYLLLIGWTMTMVPSPPSSLPGFKLIAPSIWARVPAELYHLRLQDSPTTKPPFLVLLCTWTGAQCRHIAKYTEEYQRRFPLASIMVVTTSVKDLCLRSSEQEQRRLKLAIDRIAYYHRFRLEKRTGAILMHVFSDGGSHKACELAEAYHTATGQRLPIAALCLDSTPGRPHYRPLCRAVSKALPRMPLVRRVGLLASSVFCGCIWMFYRATGFDHNVVTKTRRQILDSTYWDMAAPRCYLYSDADTIVSWEDIEDHANESICKGVPTTYVLFNGSEHVRHAENDSDRYWDAVITTWRSVDGERARVLM